MPGRNLSGGTMSMLQWEVPLLILKLIVVQLDLALMVAVEKQKVIFRSVEVVDQHSAPGNYSNEMSWALLVSGFEEWN
jgi:hypothetical protein